VCLMGRGVMKWTRIAFPRTGASVASAQRAPAVQRGQRGPFAWMLNYRNEFLMVLEAGSLRRTDSQLQHLGKVLTPWLLTVSSLGGEAMAWVWFVPSKAH
jgi:hypothetical protein